MVLVGRGGYGDGYDYGGDELKSFNGNAVAYIDGIPTAIKKAKGNLAKGFVIREDLTTEDCYVVKSGAIFAHGRTLQDARRALEEKLFEDMDIEERIESFLETFQPGIKYPAREFYKWHHILTGSCEMGRDTFVKNHGIDIENGTYTVKEFIDMTKNEYGKDVIKELKRAYEQ